MLDMLLATEGNRMEQGSQSVQLIVLVNEINNAYAGSTDSLAGGAAFGAPGILLRCESSKVSSSFFQVNHLTGRGGADAV